jgi:hypothetical protein
MEDKVMDRVRKMLNLANNAAASEGERDNALRMAHNILAKHNMTMSQVDLDGGKPVEGREHTVVKVKNKMWMTQVANSVAKLFFCNVFMSKRHDGIDLTFIGRQSNVATAKEMAIYVIESIRKEGQRRAKGDSQWHLSFNKGAAYRIHERCDELRRSAEQASTTASTGTALVLASVYETERKANEDYISKSMGITLSKSKPGRQSNVNGSAFGAGREFGGTVSLNRQVGGGSASQGRLQ